TAGPAGEEDFPTRQTCCAQFGCAARPRGERFLRRVSARAAARNDANAAPIAAPAPTSPPSGATGFAEALASTVELAPDARRAIPKSVTPGMNFAASGVARRSRATSVPPELDDPRRAFPESVAAHMLMLTAPRLWQIA